MLRLLERGLVAWADLSRRGGLILVALILALTAGAGWYAANSLKVNTDTSAMLDPTLDYLVRAAELREAFPETKSEILVVIRGRTIDETDAFLADLRQRTQAKPAIFESVFAPSEEPFFRQNGLLYLEADELEGRLTQLSRAAGLIETLVKTPTAGALFATLADNDALAARSDLGKETLDALYGELATVVEGAGDPTAAPFAWMSAIDVGGDETVTRTLSVTPKLDFTRLQPAKPAVATLRAEIDALRPEFGGRVEAYVTGDPALRADELASVTEGIGLSFLVSFLAVAFLLLVCLRSGGLALIASIALVVTITLTSAFAAAAIRELNLVSIAFTVLLVGLGIDFAIHFLLHFQERRSENDTLAAAVRDAAHDSGGGLALAVVTTIVGFLAFVPTAFHGIAQLGVIASAGVAIAFLTTFTFLPAAIAAFPNTAGPRRFKKRRGSRVLDMLSVPVAAATIVAGVVALYFLPQARFDADPMSLRDPKSPSVVGFNILFESPDTVPYRLTYVAADEAEAARVINAARALDVVRTTRSISNFVPEDQDDKLSLIDYSIGPLAFALDAAPDPAAPGPSFDKGVRALVSRLDATHPEGSPGRRLATALKAVDPTAQGVIEQRLFAYWPALIERLRDQTKAAPVDESSLPPALAARYQTEDGRRRVDILPAEDLRDPAALGRFVDAVDAAAPGVSGGAIQSRKSGETIAAAMLQATAIALGGMLAMLILIVRRPGEVALMMAPLLLAAILTVAASVVFDIPFNYANIIVLPLLLGLGIDSSIHIVLSRRRMAIGGSVHETSTPRAVLFSALTTIASFGSLMLSPHRGTASMGELLSIALAISLLCTLIVLPALFRFLKGQEPAELAQS